MPTTAPMRVLLLEDDPVSARFLADALARLPSQVDHVATLAAARARAGDGYQLWVFDVRLPDGHATSLLPELRSAGLGTPALALTADTDETTRRRLLAAGFGAVLAKPVGADALRAAARALPGARGPIGASGMPAGAVPVVDGVRDLSAPRAAAESPRAVWDDAAALAALGDVETVEALRRLFVAELPGQRRRIADACRAGDLAAAREHLHRLKAGCAFVGAAALGAAVHAIAARPGDGAALAHFEACAAALAD